MTKLNQHASPEERQALFDACREYRARITAYESEVDALREALADAIETYQQVGNSLYYIGHCDSDDIRRWEKALNREVDRDK